MTGYPQSLLTHLETYKREVLGIDEPGIFEYRGRKIPKDHILPEDAWNLNFLHGIRGQSASLRDCHGKAIQWHRFKHHLNSSQAMAVNLFQPLLTSTFGLEILAAVTGVESPTADGTGFEFVPDSEEETNIDFCVSGKDGKKLFVEVKLSEADFGRAKNDERHRKKFAAIYLPRCQGRVLLKRGKEWEEFRHDYQFYRNALFADADTRIWFLIPGVHRSLIQQAERCLEKLTEGIRSQVRIVRMGELFAGIVSRTSGDRTLTTHYEAFRRKYRPALD